MGEFLKSVACSGTDCYSWILVLFNIFAVFYLVFCSFWKVTRAAKITGWVCIAGLLCATVGILIAHTCIYTLLITIFTAMMIMAILSVILPQPNATSGEEREEKRVKLGSYVISGTDDERYVFAIHDASRKLVVKSKYSYNTVDEAKREICVCRDNGIMASISDKTGAWIKEEYYPTFEIYAKDGKYYFCLNINGEYVILNSESYGDVKSCEKMLEKAKTLVASTDVYLNTAKVSGKDYKHFGEPEGKKAVSTEAVARDEATDAVDYKNQVPSAHDDLSIADAPCAVEGIGTEIIGVMWTEAHSERKIYCYDPDGEKVEIGDVVLVPYKDQTQNKDVARMAEVVQTNYKIASEMLKRPLKKVIRVLSRKADKMLDLQKVNTDIIEEAIAKDTVAEDALTEDGLTGGVIFSSDEKTLWDKYAELSEEQKVFFDKIREHAGNKPDVKCIEAKNYLTFKYMRDKLVRLRIRKDMVEAVFMLVGSTFKNAFSEGDVKVREAATIIRVENEAYLDVALTTIDMEYEALVEERERRKEEQKAKRRKARKTALESNTDAVEAEATEKAEDSEKELITV